jgi:multiple sugar transport system substrate-binding protein
MKEIITENEVSRRSILKGAAAGAAALTVGGVGASTLGASAASAAPATVSFGSNNTNGPGPEQDAAWTAAAKAEGIVDVQLNAVDHNNFQNNINSYLQGTPDNVFDWFAGYRMQFFAQKGLLTPIDNLWKKIGSNYTAGFAGASTGLDGKKYLVPTDWYPWAIHYRKSVWKKAGVNPASIKTIADLINACKVFKSKGLVPIAQADKGGWEAQGVFDILNMRTNGFKFHIDLTAGRVPWSDPRIQKVFANWKALRPYMSAHPLDLGDQDAGKLVIQKKAAMIIMGSFTSGLYPKGEYPDLALIPFPIINPANGTDSIDAPIDGVLASNTAASNMVASEALMEFIGSTKFSGIIQAISPSLFANKHSSVPSDPFIQSQVKLVNATKHVGQFFDRDSRPDFAGPIFGPALQKYLTGGDPKSIATNLKAQWDALPPA